MRLISKFPSTSLKRIGERADPRRSPHYPRWLSPSGSDRLEAESGAEPECGWSLYQQGRSKERIENWGYSRNTTVDRISLVQSDCTLSVGDVEPVPSQTQLLILTKLNRVIST